MAFFVPDISAVAKTRLCLVGLTLKASFMGVVESRASLGTICRLLAPAGRVDLDRLTFTADVTIAVGAVVTAVTLKAFLASRSRIAVGLQVVVAKLSAARVWWALAAEAVDAGTWAGGGAERTAPRSATVPSLFS